MAAEEDGCPCYPSVGALADAVDAVFICSPPQFHISQAWEVVRAGKAIFTEKPLGPNLGECEVLVNYCEKEGIPHGHGFSMRDGALPRIREWLEDGLLGDIVSASGWVMHSGGRAGKETDWRNSAELNPGGPMFQLGTHYIDALRYLFGDGHWLAAWSRSDFTPSTVDDAFVSMGTFGNIPCTLHSHYVCAERCGLEIFGTQATLIWESNLPRLRYRRIQPKQKEDEEDWTDRLPSGPATSLLLEDFYQAIIEGRQPHCSGKDALAVIRLLSEAVEMAKRPDGIADQTALTQPRTPMAVLTNI